MKGRGGEIILIEFEAIGCEEMVSNCGLAKEGSAKFILVTRDKNMSNIRRTCRSH
jgi:hypothetical protein